MSAIITVEGLAKHYEVPVRESGLGNAIKSIFQRQYRTVKAVDGVSFRIDSGEVVGFLGPNGAGKTTTLKMLSGLLHPTGGRVSVLGYTPHQRDYNYLRQMTLVMGQRNNLVWDLPGADSFELAKTVYGVDQAQYTQTRDALVEILQLQELLTKPVRNLSLGERMKMEFALALMHQPKVLFLDEPTIGLDVTMQKRIRAFVAEYNERFGATVMLTSHYMADVDALCKRVIVIHHGTVLHDGDLADLVTRFAPTRTITLQTNADRAAVAEYGEVVAHHEGSITLKVAKHDVPRVTSHLLSHIEVSDIAISEPPIEDIIEQVYGS
ncbi:MAG: ATP-binding cassette domain-containing protein [Chloroflexi bacterium]|nr:ATP-binding cassette domain-containing protein [Chloroflexota bacterium]